MSKCPQIVQGVHSQPHWNEVSTKIILKNIVAFIALKGREYHHHDRIQSKNNVQTLWALKKMSTKIIYFNEFGSK